MPHRQTLNVSRELSPLNFSQSPNNKPMNKKLFLFTLFLIVAACAGLILRPRTSIAQSGGGSPSELVSQVVVDRPVNQSSETLDTPDSRIALAPVETVSLDVQLFSSGGVVRLLAPNGGSINGQGGKIEINTSQQPGQLNFTFTPGTTRGCYTVEISQGQSTQILQFWVGPLPPLGQPGPTLTFTPGT